VTAIRLFRSKYSPRDATGAKREGGRWNSVGREMLYASESLALACLEVLVHIKNASLLPLDYMYCEVRFSRDMLLPWYSKPERTKALIESPVLSREYGDLFLRWGEPGKGYSALPPLLIGPEPEPRGIPQKRPQSPVHKVPSVVIPREWNYLINTNHPRFEELVWGEPRAFVFDPRLI
jgi:RES domain-containing protein